MNNFKWDFRFKFHRFVVDFISFHVKSSSITGPTENCKVFEFISIKLNKLRLSFFLPQSHD